MACYCLVTLVIITIIIFFCVILFFFLNMNFGFYAMQFSRRRQRRWCESCTLQQTTDKKKIEFVDWLVFHRAELCVCALIVKKREIRFNRLWLASAERVREHTRETISHLQKRYRYNDIDLLLLDHDDDIWCVISLENWCIEFSMEEDSHIGMFCDIRRISDIFSMTIYWPHLITKNIDIYLKIFHISIMPN